MTELTDATVDSRVPDDATMLVTFTNRGERALDTLATVLTHRMARTPQGIADVLERIYRTDVDELCAALDAIAAELHPAGHSSAATAQADR